MKQVNFSEVIKEVSSRSFNVRDEFKHLPVEETQKIAKSSVKPFDILLFNILGDLNSGVIIRTSHLMGVDTVHIFGRNKIDTRSTVGCVNYTNIIKYGGMNESLEIDLEVFRKVIGNLFPVIVEQGGEDVRQFNWKENINSDGRKPCLIFGNEGFGIPNDVIDICKEMGGKLVSIPQNGVIRSHNVSVAASLAMFQMVSVMDWF